MTEKNSTGTKESTISKDENEMEEHVEPESTISLDRMQRILTHRLQRGNTGGNSLLQQRFVICIIGMFLLCHGFTLINLLCFSPNDVNYNVHIVNSSCPGLPANLTKEKLTLLTEGTLYWIKNHSLTMNSFFLGNALTQIPGGLLAERMGGKHVVGISVLLSCILTITTPTVVNLFHEKGATVLRFLLGCFMGPITPALCVVVAHWAPPQERGRIVSFLFCGEQFGIIFSTLLNFTFLKTLQFSCLYSYYIFGLIGVFWLIVWIFGIYNDPAISPFISTYEKAFLKDQLRRFVKRNKYLPATPIWEILACVPVWGLISGHISLAVLLNQHEILIPIYLRNYQKISQYLDHVFHYITSVAIITVAVSSGWLGDILLKNDPRSVERLRKSYAAAASFGSFIFLVIGVIIKCNKYAVQILFSVAVSFMGLFHSSIRINAFDLSPNYVGTITALANFFSSLVDFLSMQLIKSFISEQTHTEWELSFIILCLPLFFGCVFFLLFGKADLQHLNYPDI